MKLWLIAILILFSNFAQGNCRSFADKVLDYYKIRFVGKIDQQKLVKANLKGYETEYPTFLIKSKSIHLPRGQKDLSYSKEGVQFVSSMPSRTAMGTLDISGKYERGSYTLKILERSRISETKNRKFAGNHSNGSPTPPITHTFKFNSSCEFENYGIYKASVRGRKLIFTDPDSDDERIQILPGMDGFTINADKECSFQEYGNAERKPGLTAYTISPKIGLSGATQLNDPDYYQGLCDLAKSENNSIVSSHSYDPIFVSLIKK